MEKSTAENLRNEILHGMIPPHKSIPRKVNLNNQIRIRQFLDTEPSLWGEGLIQWIQNIDQGTLTFLGVEETLLRKRVT